MKMLWLKTILLQSNCSNSFTLSDLADISQVILALASLGLAAYIFIYQKKKDLQSENNTALLNEQNIKLQWFKELIIQPNLSSIKNFYDNLHSLKEKIDSENLDENRKIELNDYAKEESSKLRKVFIDLLFSINTEFAKKAKKNLDSLIDDITKAIFDDDLYLKNPNVYEKNIGSRITMSQNDLFSQIYNHKGL